MDSETFITHLQKYDVIPDSQNESMQLAFQHLFSATARGDVGGELVYYKFTIIISINYEYVDGEYEENGEYRSMTLPREYNLIIGTDMSYREVNGEEIEYPRSAHQYRLRPDYLERPATLGEFIDTYGETLMFEEITNSYYRDKLRSIFNTFKQSGESFEPLYNNLKTWLSNQPNPIGYLKEFVINTGFFKYVFYNSEQLIVDDIIEDLNNMADIAQVNGNISDEFKNLLIELEKTISTMCKILNICSEDEITAMNAIQHHIERFIAHLVNEDLLTTDYLNMGEQQFNIGLNLTGSLNSYEHRINVLILDALKKQIPWIMQRQVLRDGGDLQARRRMRNENAVMYFKYHPLVIYDLFYARSSHLMDTIHCRTELPTDDNFIRRDVVTRMLMETGDLGEVYDEEVQMTMFDCFNPNPAAGQNRSIAILRNQPVRSEYDEYENSLRGVKTKALDALYIHYYDHRFGGLLFDLTYAFNDILRIAAARNTLNGWDNTLASFMAVERIILKRKKTSLRNVYRTYKYNTFFKAFELGEYRNRVSRNFFNNLSRVDLQYGDAHVLDLFEPLPLNPVANP